MKRQTLVDLKKIMATLRGPQGCPWDRKQTAKSLTPYAMEESLELEDAIENKTAQDVKEELGDLLFQVIFQSQIAEEKGDFNFDDVVHSLCQKMVERHPHVFAKNKTKVTEKTVHLRWERHKTHKMSAKEFFALPQNFPALLSASKIGRKTRTIDFDWFKVKDVFAHFMSEVQELKQTLPSHNKAHQEEEIGDALFTLAQVARLLEIDPEKALRKCNQKVVRRIRKSHQLSQLSWQKYCALSIDAKEQLWAKAKKALSKEKR